MDLLAVYERLLGHFKIKDCWWPHETTFEIMVGALLTQNTAWGNVEKAIKNLKTEGILNIKSLSKTNRKKLEEAIRPSGFYKQKAGYLSEFSRYLYTKYEGDLNVFFNRNACIIRQELLLCRGIGKETADSMLLYAGNKLVFVIDAYTKRICIRLELTDLLDYDELQSFFQDNLRKDLFLYKQFHALIVELGKKFCKRIPLCEDCPLKIKCKQQGIREKLKKGESREL
ncbi:hypothetical protein KAU39_04640 [bacterium]|nr:hypothetical protein [bacterium]